MATWSMPPFLPKQQKSSLSNQLVHIMYFVTKWQTKLMARWMNAGDIIYTENRKSQHQQCVWQSPYWPCANMLYPLQSILCLISGFLDYVQFEARTTFFSVFAQSKLVEHRLVIMHYWCVNIIAVIMATNIQMGRQEKGEANLWVI